MKRKMLVFLSVFGFLMAGCPETTSTSVTIKFDANGGKGSMEELVIQSGTEAVLTQNAFTRDGFSFTGWNDSADGKGKNYADKAKVKPTADIILFAQWEAEKALEVFPKMQIVNYLNNLSESMIMLFFRAEGPLPSSNIQVHLTKEGLTDKSIIIVHEAGTAENDYAIGIGYLQENDAFTPYGEWRVRLEHPDYQPMVNELVWNVPEPTPPAALTGLKATPGDGEVVLSWSPTGDRVTHLKLTITPTGGSMMIAETDILSDTTAIKLQDLINGTEYTFSVLPVNDGAFDENNATSVTVTLPKIPQIIMRGEKGLVLVKAFDFDNETDNASIKSGISKSAADVTLDSSISFSVADGGFLNYTLNQSANRINGNVCYPLLISESQNDSGIIYAEISYKVDSVLSISGVGLGSTETDNAGRGWKTMFLYSSSDTSKGDWQVRNNNQNIGYPETPNVNQYINIGIDFSDAANKSFYQNGILIKALNDGQGDVLRGLNKYWLFFNNERAVTNRTTLVIDYIAFYQLADDASY
ncbi:MAG: InlB B-repeat-containing protein [Spirochaetia bacterium]|nr:InlB B-repeat-containing protein [Spirochaetia bacterium]